MPNKHRQHKRSVSKPASPSLRARSHLASRPPHSASTPRGAHSVKDLLARGVPVLSQAADQATRQAFWRPWLEAHLPAGLAARITGITERNGNLVVFADSPAWSARLRYAVHDLAAQIQETQPDIKEVTVRVMPRSGR